CSASSLRIRISMPSKHHRIENPPLDLTGIRVKPLGNSRLSSAFSDEECSNARSTIFATASNSVSRSINANSYPVRYGETAFPARTSSSDVSDLKMLQLAIQFSTENT